MSRFTSQPSAERMPVWSPDGTRLVFSSPRDGNPPSMFEKMSNGGNEKPFFKSDQLVQPTEWSRDGRFIVYGRRDPKTQWDIWLVPTVPDPHGAERQTVRSTFRRHSASITVICLLMENGWRTHLTNPESGKCKLARFRTVGRPIASVRGRRRRTAMAAGRQGTVLCVSRRRAHGSRDAVRRRHGAAQPLRATLFRARFGVVWGRYVRPVYAPATTVADFLCQHRR